jgi:uncharacterized protein YjiS (DUF1127 family)
MSIASTHYPVPAAEQAGPAVLAQVVRAAADSIRRRRANRSERRLLHALTEHMLRDIGIAESEIDAILAERLDGSIRPRGLHRL